MHFSDPLRRGRLVQRYKRFFADVDLEPTGTDGGGLVTAHCPNPGAMLGLNAPGRTCWVSPAAGANRKLAWTLELVEAAGAPVGVNTHRPNPLTAEALDLEAVPELAGYASVRREVKYGEASRVDFLLESPDRPRCWLEVKNCHFLREPGLAEFPDCVAARSAKHLRELSAQVAAGDRAVQLFVIQRSDAEAFETAGDIDPAYHRGLREAAAAGVEVLAYACEVSTDGVRIARRVPWRGALDE